MQGTATLHPGPAAIKTDDDGKVTYTTSGPKSTKGAFDKDRIDVITFSSNVNGDDDTVNTVTDTTDGTKAVGGPDETVSATIVWTDSNPTLVSAVATQDAQNATISRASTGKGVGSTDPYAVLSGQGKVTIRASVTFYDQYGNTTGKGSKVAIDIGAADVVIRTVSSRGVASWTATLDLADQTNQGLNSSQTVTYALQESTATPDSLAPLAGAPSVENTTVVAVRHADDDSSADATPITAVYGDENRFRINGALYTYDSDDIFISDAGADVDGEVVDMAKFAMLIGANLDTQLTTQANIEIVSYDDDGSSIFRVGTAATP